MQALLGVGELADVAPVVVGDEDDDIVRYAEPLLVVELDLLVEGPDLRALLRGLAGHFLYDVALVLEQSLHHLDDVGVGPGQGGVTVAAHAYGDEVLVVLGPLDALAEEALEFLLVLGVVPDSAVCLRVAGPLLVVAGHGLMVRGAHDNAHFVCGLGVEGIVGIERPAPHCGPHEIAAQAEDEFEYVSVELMSAEVRAVVVLHPAGEARRLVVEEDAAVFDRRLPGSVCTWLDGDVVMVLDRGVSPEIPRRNAYLLAELVDAVDRAPSVASSDDEGFRNPREGVLDHGHNVFLVLALEFGAVDLAAVEDLRDVFRAYGSDDDHPAGLRLVQDRRFLAAYGLEILLQSFQGDLNGAVVGRIGKYGGRSASGDHGETVGRQVIV